MSDSFVRSPRALAHDTTKYTDPHLFKPERFFTADGKLNDDDHVLTFGFGRR
jgi:cytochrome P450